MIKKILVFGAGYVGSSLSVLLAEYFEVVLVDVDEEKIKKIEKKQKPIDEPLLQDFLNEKSLNLSATTSYKEDLATSDLAAPDIAAAGLLNTDIRFLLKFPAASDKAVFVPSVPA